MQADAKSAKFHQHIWPLRADVLRAARMLVRDSAEADDLAQETLIKAYHAIDSFTLQPHATAKAWLMTILRRTRIDRLRAGSHNAATLSLDAAELDLPDAHVEPELPSDSSADAILQTFSDSEIIAALQNLPEEIRWTLLLVEVQGMSLEDAGTLMDVPTGTVKSRCFRGRQMLRTALAEKSRTPAASRHAT